ERTSGRCGIESHFAGLLFFGISRETVLSEISIPSLSNSPRMRGPPHSGLACVICLIRALPWELADGRPPIFRRDSMVQKSRKPLRCNLTLSLSAARGGVMLHSESPELQADREKEDAGQRWKRLNQRRRAQSGREVVNFC